MEWLLEHIWLLPVFLIGIFLGICLLCGIYYLFTEWRLERSTKRFLNQEITTDLFENLLDIKEQSENLSKSHFEENEDEVISKTVSTIQSSTEYGLNEMNIIDEFVKIENIIFAYIHNYDYQKQTDTPIYNFKLDVNGYIEDQYVLFYTPTGLKKEIMIGHYNGDIIAVDADEMKILSVQKFKKLFIESIEFLKNNKYYSSEIKKQFNLARFEKICKKGE